VGGGKMKIEVVGKNSEDKIKTLSNIDEVKSWLAEKDFEILQEFGFGDTICREYKQKVIYSEKLQKWILYNSVKEIIDIEVEDSKVYFIQKTTNYKREAKCSELGWLTVREIE
jgi:hypothetical protein